MRDAATLAHRLREAGRTGRPAALATIVATRGSAYRRPGAWMLLRADGERHGQLGAGCLEADVLERARAALATSLASVARYDGRTEDPVLGLGLECEGEVRIFVEPLGPAALTRLGAFFASLASLEDDAVLAIVLGPPGDAPEAPAPRLALSRGVVCTFGASPEIVAREAADVAREGAARLATCGGRQVAFVPVSPAPRLLVCGAEDDAVPLVGLACGLGWKVTVADHRPALANGRRFPGASLAVVEHAEIGTLLPRPAHRSAALVMSHDAKRDAAYVRALLPARLAYLGLVGSSARASRILRAAGAGEREAASVFAPAGLDVAAELPREAALSIVTEILAVLGRRRGGHLRERRAPGHAVHQLVAAV